MTTKRRNPVEYFSTMDGYPLTMVIMVVLIIFMVDTPPHHGYGLNLFRAEYPRRMNDSLRDDAISVSITADDRIYLDTQLLLPRELSSQLQERISRGAPRRLYLKVDQRAQYAAVKYVLGLAADAGIQNISFLTEQVSRRH